MDNETKKWLLCMAYSITELQELFAEQQRTKEIDPYSMAELREHTEIMKDVCKKIRDTPTID
jgi:hypothetical protein